MIINFFYAPTSDICAKPVGTMSYGMLVSSMLDTTSFISRACDFTHVRTSADVETLFGALPKLIIRVWRKMRGRL